jgi:hypothetical protein
MLGQNRGAVTKNKPGNEFQITLAEQTAGVNTD